MNQIGTYTITETIATTANSSVYRATKQESRDTVIVKVLPLNNFSATGIARFKHEYNLIKNINIAGVIKYFDLIVSERGLAIIMEDFFGRSLKDVIGKKGLPLSDFLKVASKIATILGNLHLNHIIHKDIKPHNILVDSSLSIVKITDFGISIEKQFTDATSDQSSSNGYEGTLAYISPEQTNRLNRSLDYRTDFYSLGVTFFEMLTGDVPFKESDSSKLMNAHITKPAPSPRDKNLYIPQAISDITSKLLAKDPDNRYQSGFGIAADLNTCIQELEDKGAISKFTIGQNDFSLKLSTPKSIYGRESETSFLLDEINSVKKNSCKFVFISGFAGIGKSSLVNHIHREIIFRNGIFISGKYEQFKINVPYNALFQALNENCRRIISDGNNSIEAAKEKILSAIGDDAKYLVSFIPLLKHIIDMQPKLIDHDIADSQFYTISLFIKLLNLFASPEQPLILFLDDIHWADSASIKFFESLENDCTSKNILVICSFRNNEVNKNTRFLNYLNNLKKNNIFNHIELGPLSIEAISSMLSDILRLPAANLVDLSNLLLLKTGGNPFFIIQLIKKLYDQNHIFIDPIKGWQWDLETIRTTQVSENVLELLLDKINILPQTTQNLLKYAACFGCKFSLDILSIITETPLDQLLTQLSEAVKEELLFAIGDYYVFHHDKIIEVIFNSISNENRIKINYQIGKKLLTFLSEDKQQEYIYTIADHLNDAKTLIDGKNEIVSLAKLNFSAAEKAKLSSEFESAFKYIEQGLSLLETTDWQTNYLLSLNLHTNAAELAYLNNNPDALNKYSVIVKEKAVSIYDVAPIYLIQIKNAQGQGLLMDALNCSIEILTKLNVPIPDKISKRYLLIEFIKIKFLLIGKDITFFKHHFQMTDKEKIVIINILTTISTTTFFISTEMYALTIFLRLKLFIRYGLKTEALLGILAFGILHCGVLNDYKRGFKYGKLAMDLCKVIPPGKHIGQILFRFYGLINVWKNDIRELYSGLTETFTACNDYGDYNIAGIAAFMISCFNLTCGNSINEPDPVLENMSLFLIKNELSLSLTNVNIFRQGIESLTNPSIENPHVLTGSFLDETYTIQRFKATNNKSSLAMYYTAKLTICYLFDQTASIVSVMNEYQSYKSESKSTYAYPLILFYESLIILSVNDKQHLLKFSISSRLLFTNYRLLKKMAKHASINFQNKVLLIQAEIQRVKGKHEKALKLYDEAFQESIKNKFPNEAALACEIASKFCFSKNNIEKGKVFLNNAIKFYQIWGATAMVSKLRINYSQYLKP
jgi:predicted ATPase/tRNA A-37 threonylcarbamoyl transferase component Bud32